MPRFKLIVAYDGTDFHGWQKQHPPGEAPLRTVQGVLETAVQDAVREPIRILGASRTDSGVHALGQVAAFTTGGNVATVPLNRMVPAINARLPGDVQVVDADIVDLDFDPIQHAESKGYRYAIAYGGTLARRPPLFDRRTLMWTPCGLDVEAMRAAAAGLVGTHDFASFTRLHHGKETTVRTVHACRVVPVRAGRLRIDVEGDGFLYNMVRIIAGTLLDVGRGRREPESIGPTLEARDRTAAGPTLPPEGLCLMWIRHAPAERTDG